MKRKLVKQGSATMMISLPSKWVKANRLDKGDEVDIEEIGKDIFISTKGTDKKSETSIRLVGLTESSIRTLITNAYRSGFDKINIEFENNEQFAMLQDTIVKNLIGFEITKKQQKSCIVENITEPSIEQFENILNKIFLNIEELFEATKRRFDGNDEDFESISDSIQKYDNFCRRIIVKRKLIEKNSEMFWNFLSSIIRGQREIYFADKIFDKKIKISAKTKELLLDCQNLYKIVLSAYKEKNIEKLQQVHKLEKELTYKKAYPLFEVSKGKESIIIHHIASSIRQFYLASSPLSGLIM
jgi:phosphate uptake regulator